MTRDGSYVGSVDDPRAFYLPERVESSLLWFSGAGYFEYYFANPMPPGVTIDELWFSAELCAEAPHFQMDWPSDISLYINDQLVGVYTSPGDLGDRKGKLTPDKWSGTEYGELTEWRITASGSLVNGSASSEVTIASLICSTTSQSASVSKSPRMRRTAADLTCSAQTSAITTGPAAVVHPLFGVARERGLTCARHMQGTVYARYGAGHSSAARRAARDAPTSGLR